MFNAKRNKTKDRLRGIKTFAKERSVSVKRNFSPVGLSRNSFFVKTVKPGQDFRFDVPIFGHVGCVERAFC